MHPRIVSLFSAILIATLNGITLADGRQGYYDSLHRPVGSAKHPIIYDKPAPFFTGSGPVQDSPPTLSQLKTWFFAPFGVGIGAPNLYAIQTDADAPLELVGGSAVAGFSQPSKIFVAKNLGNDYSIVWTSPDLGSVNSIAVGQLDGDVALEIAVNANQSILIFDAVTKELESSLSIPSAPAYGLAIADVDNNAVPDLIWTNSTGLYTSSVNGFYSYSSAAYPGSDLAVGNVDLDADLEIIVTRQNQASYILNGATKAIEWTYFAGMGVRVELGNLDSDAPLEIIGALGWQRITVFDGVLHAPLMDINTNHDIAALKVANVSAQPYDEIIFGDGQWGSLNVCDGTTGAVIWSFSNPDHGMTDIAVGDTDGNGVAELSFGAGYSSTGADHLYVLDSLTQLPEFVSTDVSGPFMALDFGDYDANGSPDFAYGSFESDSGYLGGTMYVRNLKSKALLTSIPGANIEFANQWRIRSANIDTDPQLEIFRTSSTAYNGTIRCLDGATFTTQFETPPIDGASYRGLVIADVDNDGLKDIVASVYREHTGAPGTYVYVYNGQNGSLKWKTVNTGQYWASLEFLRVGNLDGDPQPEIVVGDYDSQVFVYDASTHVQQLQTPQIGIRAIETAQIDNDPESDLILGDANGGIFVMNATTGAVERQILNAPAAIDGIAVADVAPALGPELLYCAGGRLYVVNLRRLGTSHYMSPFVTAGLGAHDGIVVTDVDQDGSKEILLNCEYLGVRLLETKTLLSHLK